MKKQREFHTSELVKTFAKIHGFEDKLISFRIKDFLEDYLDSELFSEIESINLKNKNLELKIKSPLLKNDFRMKKQFFLKKFQHLEGEEKIKNLVIL